MYKKYIKRLLDIILSLIGIIVLSPLLLILYILVLIFMGFPAIFKQERPGKNEKIFKLYKFRTMTNKKDKDGKLLPDNQRLPKFGKVLRSTSLDELPELFNILFGQMSFIGPRPLLVSYLEKYNSVEKRRHEVRPGLTGLAQVSGRNAITWENKFRKDIEYIDNLNFKLDIKIFFLTIKKVFVREGIENKNHGTIQEYFESNDRLKK